MTDLLIWLFILVSYGAAAARLSRILGLKFADDGEEIVICLALGLGIAGYAVFIIGSMGYLFRPAMLAVSAAFLFLGGGSFTALAGRFAAKAWRSLRGARDPLIFVLGFLILTAAVFSVFGALAPATGQDELSYHLTHPKWYVENHRVYEILFSTPALWPSLGEMLFALGLLLKGAGVAKLSHFTAYALTGFALFQFVSRFDSRKTAFFSAAVFLLTPAAFIQGAFAYVDNTLALFVFLSLYALYVFLRAEGGVPWAILSGVFMGLALSVKFTALFVLPWVSVLLLASILLKKDKKEALIHAAWWAVAAFLCGAVWYLRAYWLRGNPVFPFFNQFFGGGGTRMVIDTSVHGMGRDAVAFVRLFWDLTMHPEHFGGEHIGVLYLIGVPAFLFLRPYPCYARYCALGGLSYMFFWFIMDQNMRFLFPALALFSPAVGVTLKALVSGGSSLWEAGLRLLIGACFLFQALFSIYHFRDEAALFFGRLTERDYLLTHERSYAAAEAINREITAADKILSIGEVRGYYFRGLLVNESELSAFTFYEQKNNSPEDVVAFLKDNGFTHVLLAGPAPSKACLEQGLSVQNILADETLKKRFFKDEIIFTHRQSQYVLYRIL